MYSAKIICDSISETRKRITTFEITFPRIVLAEFNTHRMLSRNSASSRAIPIERQIQRVMNDPFIPEKFPCNGKGMQPEYYIGEEAAPIYKEAWLNCRDSSVNNAVRLHELGIHKQIVNRLLEPFMWHTVIVTATEWDNFFKLRTHKDAQYEIRRIADLMYDLYHNEHEKTCNKVLFNGNCDCARQYITKQLKVGEWHLPFIYHDENYTAINNWINNHAATLRIEGFHIPTEQITHIGTKVFTEILKRISVARCARVSYLTHDGKRDIEKDLELFEKLRTSGHWSPFEHVATPAYHIGMSTDIDSSEFRTTMDERSGNFIGWKQFRKEFQDENCTYFRKEQ